MAVQRNSGSDKELLIIISSSGHVVSTIQLANTILRHRRLIISLLVIPPMTEDPNFSGKLSKCDPDINLVTLPKLQLDPAFREPSYENFFGLLMQYIDLHKDAVRAAVKHQQLLASSETDIGEDKSEKEQDRIFKSTSFILDWFCASSMMDVAAELGSNAYVYYTDSAAFLGLLALLLPTRSRLLDTVGIEAK